MPLGIQHSGFQCKRECICVYIYIHMHIHIYRYTYIVVAGEYKPLASSRTGGPVLPCLHLRRHVRWSGALALSAVRRAGQRGFVDKPCLYQSSTRQGESDVMARLFLILQILVRQAAQRHGRGTGPILIAPWEDQWALSLGCYIANLAVAPRPVPPPARTMRGKSRAFLQVLCRHQRATGAATDTGGRQRRLRSK